MSLPDGTVRDRLVLGLDVGGLDVALPLAKRLAPWFDTVKVGYELYAEAGPGAFSAMHDLGFAVFADLKLYDIPTTVQRGARAIGRHGVEFLNFHAAGGAEMLRAGVDGLREGARDGGHGTPIALGVTVLTSEPDTAAFGERLAAAEEGGCDGVVCAAGECAAVRAAGLRSMVPGIRLPGGDRHDQARVATPSEAIAQGADWIILARAVTAADDPEREAEAATLMVADAVAAA